MYPLLSIKRKQRNDYRVSICLSHERNAVPAPLHAIADCLRVVQWAEPWSDSTTQGLTSHTSLNENRR